MFYKQMLNSAGVVMTSVRGNLCPSQARRGDGRVSGRAGVPGPAVVEWGGGAAMVGDFCQMSGFFFSGSESSRVTFALPGICIPCTR